MAQRAGAPPDGPDAAEILGDLERLCLRHARLAAAGLGTLGTLAMALEGAARLRRGFAAAGTAAPIRISRAAADLEVLQQDTQALVEALSTRHASRFGELVREGAGEAAREAGTDSTVAVDVQAPAENGGPWVPRAEAALWRDLVRNLVRNGIQASEERLASEPQAAANLVTVSMRPSPSAGGATLEVLDAGVGMTRDAAASMWHAGTSSHGAAHGQGLTEAKRDFVLGRAALEVRSAPGAGTCVRIELSRRDIALRRPRLWETPAVAAAFAIVVLAVTGAVALQPQPEIAMGEIQDRHVVVARNADGEVMFRTPLPTEIVDNDRGSVMQRPLERKRHLAPLVLPPSVRGGAGIAVATRREGRPPVIHRLDARGEIVWECEPRWIDPTPPVDSADPLSCRFLDLVGWSFDSAGAIALNVRQGDAGPTSIQFYSTTGESLGAYYHPGHLTPCGTYDLDGDGRYEALFGGVNNRAGYDTTFVPQYPGDQFYVDCLVLLDSRSVGGQAYPYSRWNRMPHAREAAYVLFPLLEPGRRPDIVRASVQPGRTSDTSRIDVVLNDGRVYRLDGRLKPVACTLGDHTRADSLRLRFPYTPFLWFHDGVRERIDLPIGGE